MRKTVSLDIPGSKLTAMPERVSPMLCTLTKEVINDPAFLYEVKWDGYRAMAYKGGQSVRVESRSGLDFTKKYPTITRALLSLPFDAVLDGEIVYLNEKGKPDFDALQKVNRTNAPVYFYAFDVLWVDGVNLMSCELIRRKAVLEVLLGDIPDVRVSETFDEGPGLFQQMEASRMEGIIAKRKLSVYQPGKRGKLWYKIPTEIRQEFVIGGWIESDRDRPFRTLLFGAYDGEKLRWIGHAGGGYKEAEMPAILKKLKLLEIRASPFANKVEYDGIAHWVKPVLVANIKYATTTRSGKIRKPAIFLGFRGDKPANEVVREIPAVPDLQTAFDSNWPAIENVRITSEETFSIDDCELKLQNVEKQIWKNVTKADLIQYYLEVRSLILNQVKDRPLSLYVKLKGPHAPGLYIKDMEGRQPACASVFTVPRKHKKEGKREVIDYLVCNNTATLLYVINLGCIDINPWTSSTHHPQRPDYVVIDLDPSDGDFAKAVEAAKAAREFLNTAGLGPFIKTSGKTGIHIYIPCSAFTFPQARNIAENICISIHRLVPRITTTEMDISLRGNRLYLDPNQNDFTDTVACAYSVRPASHPTVSTPISWSELKTGITPDAFTMHDISRRLKKRGVEKLFDVNNPLIARKNDKILQQFLGL